MGEREEKQKGKEKKKGRREKTVFFYSQLTHIAQVVKYQCHCQ